MIHDYVNHTLTLNKEEITSLLNCLYPFKNADDENREKELEEVISSDDLMIAREWYNKLINV